MELPIATTRTAPDRALVSSRRLEQSTRKMVSEISAEDSVKNAAATMSTPRELHEHLSRSESQRGTMLYLAYGSNLSNETFRGNRGIKPLSQVNVQVPSLRLTFDLPGLPYAEPCFANTARRDPKNDPAQDGRNVEENEKCGSSEVRRNEEKYRKNRWHKGLIGVVYEVTPEDYAHIIPPNPCPKTQQLQHSKRIRSLRRLRYLVKNHQRTVVDSNVLTQAMRKHLQDT
jgi:hypothetical protein